MPDLLTIERLSAGYGEAVVLNEVSLALAEGQSLALLGRNGMGKTTLINSIVGVTRFIGGTIALDGRDITPLAPRPARARRHRLGAAGAQHLQVAHGRGEPHRRGAARAVDAGAHLRAVPAPAERRRNLGNQLSGGEQQMLAVGRALILNPRVMLLDEPLEGLAPIIVEELLRGAAAHHPRRGHVRDPGRAERAEGARRHRPGGDPRARRRGLRGRERGPRPPIARCWRAISASPPSGLAAAARPGIDGAPCEMP